VVAWCYAALSSAVHAPWTPAQPMHPCTHAPAHPRTTHMHPTTLPAISFQAGPGRPSSPPSTPPSWRPSGPPHPRLSPRCPPVGGFTGVGTAGGLPQEVAGAQLRGLFVQQHTPRSAVRASGIPSIARRPPLGSAPCWVPVSALLSSCQGLAEFLHSVLMRTFCYTRCCALVLIS